MDAAQIWVFCHSVCVRSQSEHSQVSRLMRVAEGFGATQDATVDLDVLISRSIPYEQLQDGITHIGVWDHSGHQVYGVEELWS